MNSHLRPSYALKPLIVASSLIVSMGLTTLGAHAAPDLPSGEHATKDVDITQPIKALDNLSSLKNEKKLQECVDKRVGNDILYTQTKLQTMNFKEI